MSKTKLKPLPLYTNPARSMSEYVQRVVRLLSLGWCQNNLGIDKYGLPATSCSPSAVAVCAIGALRRSNPGNEDKYFKLMAHIEVEIGGYIVTFNNDPSTTQKRVIYVFRHAAQKLGVNLAKKGASK